ncbi:MAG: hypothetical protein ABH848_05170 [Candidatus Omnitrophota bacterium]
MKYIKLSKKVKSDILALGAQGKASFAIGKKDKLYFSESFGDMSEAENFKVFKKAIDRELKRLKAYPKVIVCDMHPEYTSTKLAEDIVGNGVKLKKVQHHKAHIAGSMIDNDIKGKVIGVSFDGTGYGEDGYIWGGEVFVGGLSGLKRVAHLKYVPMPGGEKVIYEPWRMAFSYLYDSYGPKAKDMKLSFLSKVNKTTLDVLIQAIDKNINSPLTSSMGRLFDAVSSLTGICINAKLDAEPAIALEKKMDEATSCKTQDTRHKSQATGKTYKFDIKKEKDSYAISADNIIKNIVSDVKRKVRPGVISFKFHEAVVVMIKDMCKILRKRYRINKIVLSGGVFQNNFLKEKAPVLLKKEGFKVYLHKDVPTHDGGISVGQVALCV